MKIVVRAKADEDLDGFFAWIAKDNPARLAKCSGAFARGSACLSKPLFRIWGILAANRAHAN